MPSEPLNPILFRRSPATLEDPLYYLHNFRWVLDWVYSRYSDLLSADEQAFVSDFRDLPNASQGLFVRMVMRKGRLFRADKLRYPELGPTDQAVAKLVADGWVNAAPVLDLESLFTLFTWPELRKMLATSLNEVGLSGTLAKSARKADALIALTELGLKPATLAQWCAGDAYGDAPIVYELEWMPLCDRFRVMFFGNAHQDWSEFVLTELGMFEYESVEFREASRPFHSRAEIDAYLQLQSCRERFYDTQPLDAEAMNAIENSVPTLPSANPWLVRGRDRLVFKIAREWERAGELKRAQSLYQGCGHPEARSRHLRVLELQQDYRRALALAEQAQKAPESEAERQQLQRLLPRLQRKLGIKRSDSVPVSAHTEELQLTLPQALSVEQAVKQYLETADAPVYYVENTLLTGLFGLLCWEAIFAPLPGAFFHPFQRGPADLHWPDFYPRRAHLFEGCFRLLDEDNHRACIMNDFEKKSGRQSPFVHWGALSKTLIEQALACIPPAHLKLCFERLLLDLKANRAGLPDLIQLWPEKREYRMIEVKGPGDRLQDNQKRWLDFFAVHKMPAVVCYVQWESPGADLS